MSSQAAVFVATFIVGVLQAALAGLAWAYGRKVPRIRFRDLTPKGRRAALVGYAVSAPIAVAIVLAIEGYVAQVIVGYGLLGLMAGNALLAIVGVPLAHSWERRRERRGAKPL